MQILSAFLVLSDEYNCFSFIELIQLNARLSVLVSHVALSCWRGHMQIKNVSTFFTCYVVIASNVSRK